VSWTVFGQRSSFDRAVRRKSLAVAAGAISYGISIAFLIGEHSVRFIPGWVNCPSVANIIVQWVPVQGIRVRLSTPHAKRLPRQRLSCVLGTLSSLEV